jgi:hypothetical protein
MKHLDLCFYWLWDAVQEGVIAPVYVSTKENVADLFTKRSTKDAGLFLTHLVKAGWVQGLKTSIVAFNIAQFFPLLNHEMLMVVLAWHGFPEHVRKFFASYLVGRDTRYLWNLFSSDRRSTDVGMGQGSALSLVLSALYLAPVIKLFESQVAHLDCDVLSYVDDGTLIVQAKDWGSNLKHLREAYRIVFNLFECFGLVLEHDKSELFHFTCKHGDTNPPLALGWGPFTKETPLKPKEHWRYLGFFFDCHLLFHEHVHFYATKAISTVCAMGMLGNVFRRLSPRQKHILYRLCIIPIAMYGFKLWYYSGAHCKGQVAKLAKMQHHTALWITGAFCTSPVGGVGALLGLIPINLHLQKLAAWLLYWITTLSPTHPLAALRQRAGSKKVPQHRHSLSKLDYDTRLWVHSSFAKAVHACRLLNEPFDADADHPFFPINSHHLWILGSLHSIIALCLGMVHSPGCPGMMTVKKKKMTR